MDLLQRSDSSPAATSWQNKGLFVKLGVLYGELPLIDKHGGDDNDNDLRLSPGCTLQALVLLPWSDPIVVVSRLHLRH